MTNLISTATRLAIAAEQLREARAGRGTPEVIAAFRQNLKLGRGTLKGLGTSRKELDKLEAKLALSSVSNTLERIGRGDYRSHGVDTSEIVREFARLRLQKIEALVGWDNLPEWARAFLFAPPMEDDRDDVFDDTVDGWVVGFS